MALELLVNQITKLSRKLEAVTETELKAPIRLQKTTFSPLIAITKYEDVGDLVIETVTNC